MKGFARGVRRWEWVGYLLRGKGEGDKMEGLKGETGEGTTFDM